MIRISVVSYIVEQYCLITHIVVRMSQLTSVYDHSLQAYSLR